MDNYDDFGIDIPFGKTSGQIKVRCPNCISKRHNKRDKSLSVNLDEGVWNCHYCGFAGTVKKGNGEHWADKIKPVPEKKPPRRPVWHYNPNLSEKLIKYFIEERRISQATLAEMKISEGLEKMPQADNKEVNTVQFPYFRDAELVNVKYRTGGKDFKLSYGCDLIPYNLDAIKGTDECAITEGEIDTLSYIEAGYKTVVSVPNGASANLAFLNSCLKTHFDDKKVIYIAADSDSKGVVLRDALVAKFGADRCRVVEYGEGCKDANEHLKKYGRESLLETLKNAKPPEATPPSKQHDAGFPNANNEYFNILGFQKDSEQKFIFYEKRSMQTIERTPATLTKNNLLHLADMNFWETYFPGKRGFDIDEAIQWLMTTAKLKGIVSPDRFRGRGAWFDNGDVVFHDGGRLIVNDKHVDIGDYKTWYIYEQGEPLGFDVVEPLSVEEANKYIEMTSLINFEREIDRYLFIGWCAIAPICGALSWRPHLWLVGKSKSGKSWTMREIIRPMLGKTALSFQGATTSAGIRQKLKSDALNPVIDEAFGEASNDTLRIQEIISLARIASTDDSGVVAKGTVSQTGKAFLLRGCFAFSSINDILYQTSDKSRITVVGIKPGNPDERFNELKKIIPKLMDKKVIARLHSRTLSLIPTILKNIETFTNVMYPIIGDKRAGEQIGTLLAGAYSLRSNREITEDEAVKWCYQFDWEREKGLADETDEESLTSRVTDELVTVTASDGKLRKRTIGELMQSAMGMKPDDYEVNQEIADKELQRIGIRCRDGCAYFAQNHKAIQKLLGGTAWERNYHKVMLRAQGAVESRCYFAGRRCRAVAIPFMYFEMDGPDNRYVQVEVEPLPF